MNTLSTNFHPAWNAINASRTPPVGPRRQNIDVCVDKSQSESGCEDPRDDIVVLTNEKARYLDDDEWVAMALVEPAEIVSAQDWGPLSERRVRLSCGLEVEFGFVPPSWAATDPVDPGTASIVRDGCKPIEDSGAVFERLIAAL
jgi:hypothetical protein